MNDRDIRLGRRCRYYKSQNNKVEIIKDKYEVCQEIISDVMSYTFYRIEKSNDFEKLKDIKKHFMIAKNKTENQLNIKNKKKLKEYEDEVNILLQNTLSMITIDSLMLIDFEVNQVIPSIIIELNVGEIVAVALRNNSIRKATDYTMTFRVPTIVKTEKGTYIPYLFLYCGENEDVLMDPLINLTHMYFAVVGKPLEKMFIFDMKNRRRVVIESPKIQQFVFLRELMELATDDLQNKSFGSKCETCEIKEECLSETIYRRRSRANFGIDQNFKQDKKLSITLKDIPENFKKGGGKFC